jgi:hypothetical protein
VADPITKTVELDLEYQGDAMQYDIPGGGSVGFRRYHRAAAFGVAGSPAVWLYADEAEAIGIQLLAAAEAMRRCDHGQSTAAPYRPEVDRA